MALVRPNVSPLNHGGSGRRLSKCDFGDDVSVANDRTAAGADFPDLIVDDSRVGAVGVGACGCSRLVGGFWLHASARGRVSETGKTLDRLAVRWSRRWRRHDDRERRRLAKDRGIRDEKASL